MGTPKAHADPEARSTEEADEEAVSRWEDLRYEVICRRSYHRMMGEWYGLWVLRLQILGTALMALGAMGFDGVPRAATIGVGMLTLVVVHILRWHERAAEHGELRDGFGTLIAMSAGLTPSWEALRDLERQIESLKSNGLPTRRVVLALAHNRYAEKLGGHNDYRIRLRWHHRTFPFLFGNIELHNNYNADNR